MTDQSSKFTTIIKLVLVAIGMYAVVTRMWACEDAYISFRYIYNLLNGYGLVYNIGERVEGFTHPLWIFLITIPAFLGASIRASALWLSLLCTLAALLLVAFRDRDFGGREVALPLALILFATHSGFRDFAASGLEFPLVLLLLVWFYISYKRHGLLGKPSLHGALLAMLYLARPELVLLALSFYLVEFVRLPALLRRTEERRRWIADLLRLSLPFAVLAGGYHLFRVLYYGEFFPNTYYAKSGLGSYWPQGVAYLEHFWHYSPVLLVTTIVFLGMLLISESYRRGFFSDSRRTVMIVQAALLTLYVTRLGGDFMAFRFLLPPMVILALTMNDLLVPLYDRLRDKRAIPLLGVVVALILTLAPPSVPQRVGHIADERQYYDLIQPAWKSLFEAPIMHRWYQIGLEAREKQRQDSCHFTIATGNIGYLGYAAGPKVRIVDAYGLTDRDVARNWEVITKRGRPGHELKLRLPMAIEKGVTFWETPFREWNQFLLTDFGVLITLDPKTLKCFPDQVLALKALKAQLIAAGKQNQPVYKFLEFLEEKYSVRVEDLKV